MMEKRVGVSHLHGSVNEILSCLVVYTAASTLLTRCNTGTVYPLGQLRRSAVVVFHTEKESPKKKSETIMLLKKTRKITRAVRHTYRCDHGKRCDDAVKTTENNRLNVPARWRRVARRARELGYQLHLLLRKKKVEQVG